ncbi:MULTISPECIES: 4-hydroxy-3-methylbut-2-enyl diphosphate reductase [Streptomyces]|uniref:4-hydroxy-3-methylbut-2-enyl diphosphate reductase n=1 Tax=Streptomyces TaxID=1883 RepID=UPI001CCDB661|nr:MULTISPECIES: 4-hydroxy-3-methylbut-2-enyl diphosphate reductase [Streptomyces]UBI39258.1 4-hydroxy-3-methylbut-2-enyl diphosphate reductase [Streptomyces mobaraensis]UKW31839.1 4-hydroxy-3-methylbut-2-enyl diphosphate reductase [Streptomyces sp. TYQ1024]
MSVVSAVSIPAPARKRIILAEPRGFCAGVRRAIGMVERALEIHGAPVYVRHEIVHNKYVVRSLEKKGAVFVESEEEVPEGAVCVFSAHGVSPRVRDNSAARRLDVIDATCPLVSKVHQEARRFATTGHTILLIGHARHEEVVGTVGEAPEHTIVIETVEDARTVRIPEGTSVSYLTQTTLSLDETRDITEELVRRFPDIKGPGSDDICYASQNRQNAVKELASKAQLVLVVGSDNSSNSIRMVEVAQRHGVRAHLVDNVSRLDESWLRGVDSVGVTAGASAPEILVEQLVDRLGELGYDQVDTLTTVEEDVVFAMPGSLGGPR